VSVEVGRCHLPLGTAFIQLVTAWTPASDFPCCILSWLLAELLFVAENRLKSYVHRCGMCAGGQPGGHNLARYIDMQLPHELGLPPQRCAVAAGQTIHSHDDAKCQQNSSSGSERLHGSFEQAASVAAATQMVPGGIQFGEVLQEAAFLARFRI
jgi:hypothetical protein